MTKTSDDRPQSSVIPRIKLDHAPAASANYQRNAALALALATVFWGCGFTWAKMGGAAIQDAAGLPRQSAFGPVFLLGWRFTAGGVVWLSLFPAARRGWTWLGAARALGIGILLAMGLILQHIGLDRTTEAVSAFLTSLTILFVPLLMTFALGKPPPALLWLGVVIATAGVWLMTGFKPGGFGIGELLGLSCALGFSIYILAVNAASVHETPWRLTGGQFLVVGAACFITCAFLPGGIRNMAPHAATHILAQPRVWTNVSLMVMFPTLAAFGILNHFQPRIDPTRAALIYLIEPVVAAIYAMIAVGHFPDGPAAAGAGLILIANVLVELLSSRAARAENPVVLE
jgi:drug/metabolite transporter (DMT)-like permease